MHDRLQATLDGRMSRIKQLLESVEEDEEGEIEEIEPPPQREKRRASTEMLQAGPSQQ